MKNILMVVAIGAFVLGSMVAVGLLLEQTPQQPNVIYYNVPVSVPTESEYESVQQATATSSSYAVINVR